MKTLIKSLLLCFLTLLSVNLFAAPLTFGVNINSANNETIVVNRASYQHFVTALSKQLKTPVKLVVYSDPMSLTNAVAAGKVDLAYAKVVPFIKTNLANKNIIPLATVLSWNQDKTKMVDTYSSYLVTLASNKNINKLSDLNNVKFGFAKNSISGYYFPAYYLQRHNIAYSYHFYDSQYAAFQALKQGKVSVIALWDSNYNLNKMKSQLKTIETLSNVPNPIIVVSNKVSAADQAKIKQVILALPHTAYQGLAFAGVENYNSNLYRNAYAAVKSVAGPSA